MPDQGKTPLRKLLRVPAGGVDLSAYDAGGKPGGPKRKKAGLAATADLGKELAGLQDRLWASSTAGDPRRVLLVLQGMDTSGKGGTVKHVIGMLHPYGTHTKAFKAPTAEEREHHFLWRVEKEVPAAGEIGTFDRSHYEDVLAARVRELAPPEEIERRYDEINRFEQRLADDRVTVVKCFLHISYEEQRRRLLRRLDRADKQWKFSPDDIDDRALWPAYQKAYEIVLNRCNTPHAPWYLIPADRKWYRNWAVGRLLLEHLRALDPQYPKPGYDVEECRRRLLGG
ncbi:polyphosphate kinase 2 family protein [Streptomyces spinosirectus]|uniref:PPK2 family polyphosphate kinase n=1 Tax=Streptomyces TaxID=1883 RepID=UPI000D383462|nr:MULTISPECIES: PPK2 family polyphosphate kinase [Streptomyces]MBY8338969.1 polyphosphate kinase 2 family protein [Streptomyces plumbidurans]PTN00268.1 PPK2 family polyphosphate:nucleotide phosphotransferase [Streptomyces sp. VMFN-G11Ma]UIR21069.1 polyphosphate kinase 2 family protein [Streptomyces spinosirectus]